jgi:hypothetical protein
MSDPEREYQHLLQHGSTGAKLLAEVLHGNFSAGTMTLHDGMMALRSMDSGYQRDQLMAHLEEKGFAISIAPDGIVLVNGRADVKSVDGRDLEEAIDRLVMHAGENVLGKVLFEMSTAFLRRCVAERELCTPKKVG